MAHQVGDVVFNRAPGSGAARKKIRILSIDGGGIRGVVPALLLRRLEQDLNLPIHRLFDYVVGTSTGGLIALALAKPGVAGSPAFSAASVADFYEREGPTLFAARRSSLLPFGKPRYGNAGVEEVVRRTLGNTLLSESLTEVMVTAYDMSNRCPKLFLSWEARELNSENFYMRDVARATTAAPTYFTPALVAAHDSTAPPLHLVDGGVFANNPTARGFFEVTHEELKRGASLEDTEFIVVSLGTGMFKKPYAHAQTKNWGLLEWSRPLLDVVFDGIGETVDYQLRGMFASGRWQGRYYRFQGELDPTGAELDNASKPCMQRLRDLAGRIYERNKDSYGQMVRDLMSPGEVSGISIPVGVPERTQDPEGVRPEDIPGGFWSRTRQGSRKLIHCISGGT